MEYIKKHLDEIYDSYIKHLIDIMTTTESVDEANKAFDSLVNFAMADVEGDK